MAESEPSPFAAAGRFGRFAANPHLYSYVHTLDFKPAGAVEMVDGAGQTLFTLIQGRFSVERVSPTAFHLLLTDLAELNPYYKRERFRHLDLAAYVRATAGEVPYEEHDVRSRPGPMRIQVLQEDGPFVLRQQIIWKLDDEEDWPYLEFRVRYRFAVDPLAAFVANRRGPFYESLTPPEPDTRVYYRMVDAQKRTRRELTRAGITLEDEAS